MPRDHPSSVLQIRFSLSSRRRLNSGFIRLRQDTLDIPPLMFYHQTSDANVPNDLSEETTRTTIDLEEDVLLAAKEIARQRGNTVGQVLSDLARQTLTRRAPVSKKHGLPLFPVQPDAGVVTPELVSRLRDETP